MIERFNFYDLYGYLIPGVVALLVLATPSVWLGHVSLESNEWVALIVGVVIAYVLGHVVQSIASTALPSSRDPARQDHTYYSVRLLGKESSLSERAKELIERGVKSRFNLDIKIGEHAGKDLGKVRQDAFHLCRQVLSEKSNYSEQFEGMYVMMRGLTIGMWLGAAYTAGCSISGLLRTFDAPGQSVNCAVVWVAWLVAGALFPALIVGALLIILLSWLSYQQPPWLFDPKDKAKEGKRRKQLNVATLVLLIVSLLIAGYLLGGPMALVTRVELGFLAGFYLFVSFRFLNAYYFFAELFAKTVWLQFAAQTGTGA